MQAKIQIPSFSQSPINENQTTVFIRKAWLVISCPLFLNTL